jgi:hypothetical protein
MRQLTDAEHEEFRKACRSNSARLIKKLYEVDPLLCPKCAGPMEIISFIEDPETIKTILAHLRLWDTAARPPPAAVPLPDTACDYKFFEGLVS